MGDERPLPDDGLGVESRCIDPPASGRAGRRFGRSKRARRPTIFSASSRRSPTRSLGRLTRRPCPSFWPSRTKSRRGC